MAAAAALVRENPRAARCLLPAGDETGQIELTEAFLPREVARTLSGEFAKWCDDRALSREVVVRGGKRHEMGRKTAHFGDDDISYKYAGKRRFAKQWRATRLGRLAKRVLDEVERQTGETFNYCLINRYRPQDGLGEHSDDETGLADGASIAGVSFGATRDIVFREKGGRGRKIVQALPSGSLFLMKGDLQKYWKHGVPVRKRAMGDRISLTFRRMKK
jgi:alkylated DNA repair dioxygenase AlkB